MVTTEPATTDPLLLAVYGTLRRGGGGRRRAGLAEGDLEDLGPCRIPGRLLHLGAYPGLVEGDGAVVGELVRCAGADVLDRLDAFEGADPVLPFDPLFVRRPCALLAPAGTTAWIYRFAGAAEGWPVLAGGDWLRRPAGGAAPEEGGRRP